MYKYHTNTVPGLKQSAVSFLDILEACLLFEPLFVEEKHVSPDPDWCPLWRLKM